MRSVPARLLAVALAVGLGGCGKLQPRLLLVITADTLRADRLGAYGSPLGLTPALDRLAAQSSRFEHAYTPVPMTLPALTALMTGRYPQELRVRTNVSILSDESITLAAVLRESGWHTAAVVSSLVLDPQSRIDHGFEHYDHQLPAHELNRSVPERLAPDTTDAAIAMLRDLAPQASRPLFLWVHYQDAHGPYTPPAECAAPAGPPPPGVHDRILPVSADDRGDGAIPRYQLLGELRESSAYRAAYHGEIRCLDRGVARLLAEVERLGLLERSVIVFAADHGEDLGEEDSWFVHGVHVARSETQVPLLVRVPDRPPERRGDAASLLDVTPTLLRLAGVTPPERMRGRDLFGVAARYRQSRVFMAVPEALADVPRFGLVAGGYRYVLAEQPDGALERLRRLDPPLDELAGAQPRRVRRMRERVSEWRQQLAGMPPERRLQPSPALRQGLQALGYVP